METNAAVAISFIVYSLFIIGFGLYSTRWSKKSDDDFVLASRELGPWASSLSASASAESGWVMLGLVGLAYTSGGSAFWIIPGIAIGYLFNWFVIAERLRKATLESGAVTLPQYIMHRFGKNSPSLRLISVLIITLSMLGYVAAQMNAAGKAFEAIFQMDYTWGVLAGAFIVLAYTVTGGFRAICWTDIIQASFMFLALIVMPLVVLSAIGGYESFVEKASVIDPNILTFTDDKIGWSAIGFVAGLLGIGLGYPGQPHVLSRFMASKDEKTIKRGGLIAIVWMVVVYIGAIYFGLFAKVYFPALSDPEQALPLACGEFLPPVLAGFVVAAIVAAICSTADSQLMVVSSTFSRDLFPFLRKSKKTTFESRQRWDRWTLVVLALISVAFALTENRMIFTFVLYAWSVLGASFGPVVILGLLWKKTSKAGAIAGMITGLLVTIIWRNTPMLKSALYELVPAFVLAFIMTWLFTILLPSDEQHKQAGENS